MYYSLTRLTIAALVCLTISLLAGCGTKGPLYIPEQRYPQETNKPAASNANSPSNNSASPTQPTAKE